MNELTLHDRLLLAKSWLISEEWALAMAQINSALDMVPCTDEDCCAPESMHSIVAAREAREAA